MKYRLRVNEKKCKFFLNKIDYCGYTIDAAGIHKMQGKIHAVVNVCRPINKLQIQSSIGLINYYRRFLPNLSSILQPLCNLLRKNVPFKWDENCEKSFKQVKELILSERVLANFDPKLPLVLATDALLYGVGAVVSYIYLDGSERPIYFASQSLNNTQRKYAQIDKKAYSIIFGVKRLYHYLNGQKFILYTDQKPIVQIFNTDKSLPTLTTTSMQYYALYLRGFDFEIKYKKNELHTNAVGMSRLPTNLKNLISNQVDTADVLN